MGPTAEQLEWRRKWVEALRSGKYQQGKGSLNDGTKFCCLGVLCDLLEKEGVLKSHQLDSGPVQYFSEENHWPQAGVLPYTARKTVGVWSYGDRKENKPNLVYLNDTGSSFDEIATIIEKGELLNYVE